MNDAIGFAGGPAQDIEILKLAEHRRAAVAANLSLFALVRTKPATV